MQEIKWDFFKTESKEMFYLFGASFRCFSHFGTWGEFRSRHLELIKNFQKMLDYEEGLYSDPRGLNSYFIRIYDKNLCDFLKEDLGLAEDKSQRKFPNFDYEKYLDHFVRGFHDAEAYVKKRTENESSIIEMQFNPVFLNKLNELMKEYVGIEREYTWNKKLIYGLHDAVKFYNYIYKDRRFINKSGLYLPSKMEAFNAQYEPKSKAYFNRQIRKMPDIQGCSAG